MYVYHAVQFQKALNRLHSGTATNRNLAHKEIHYTKITFGRVWFVICRETIFRNFVFNLEASEKGQITFLKLRNYSKNARNFSENYFKTYLYHVLHMHNRRRFVTVALYSQR
jgi:hypothetical protein